MLKIKQKRKEIRVRAPIAICEWAEREAKAYGVSMTAVVVDALDDHIRRHARKAEAPQEKASQ